MAVLPIFLAIVTITVWAIILKRRGQSEKLQTRFISTYIILLFLTHPSVTQIMIDAFNCQDYDGDSRMKKDLTIICGKGLHYYMSFFVAGPLIVIWGLGIPASVFVLLRREKDRLDTLAVKEKFGFLFGGYKKTSYFWEIVIMYRKIIMIFISVFLNTIGLVVQVSYANGQY